MEPEPLVFIIDDDASVRAGLERLMRSVGLRAETFASPRAFLQRQRYEGPSCLILDVRLPGLSGLALQKALVTEGRVIPIIFITGHGDIPMSVRAMKAGAIDFLAKPVRGQDLIDAVQQAIAKVQQTRQERATREDAQRRVHILTARECEVLSLVVGGLLNKQIAAALGMSEKTVKAHRSMIMRKLQVQSLAQLVLLAEKAGLTPPQV